MAEEQSQNSQSVEDEQAADPSLDPQHTVASPESRPRPAPAENHEHTVASSKPTSGLATPSKSSPESSLFPTAQQAQAAATPVASVGKYLVKELLGRGGMGRVYRAFQATLDRDVAIKVINTRFARDPKFVELFQREARVIAGLRHHGIVRVYDFDVVGTAFYMVMEFVPGESLYDYLTKCRAQGEWIPLPEALLLFHGVVEAVAYAHSQQVIHQDLKPANILLTDDRRPVLADFGLSKIINAQPYGAKGSASGTPAYLSPEQGRGVETDRRTDVYSLGVILYELTTGVRPFQGDSSIDLIRKHISEPIRPPREVNPNLPEAVETIIQKTLAKDRDKRYGSAQALLEALEETVWPQMGFAPALAPPLSELKPFTGQNPYRGLHKFTEKEAEFFFGRQEAIQSLLSMVTQAIQTGSSTPHAPKLITVLGPSGSGKSSLVQAGLIPALRAGRGDLDSASKADEAGLNSRAWPIKVMTPGPHPLDALAEQFIEETGQKLSSLRTTLQNDPHSLPALATETLGWHADEAFVLLVIDQFEELFTLGEDESERQTFLDRLLQAALDESSRLLIILNIRADFYAKVGAYRRLAEAVTQRQLLVTPLTREELREAILLPAEAVGLRLEKTLVEALLEDTLGAAGGLPLLQHVLQDLFNDRDGYILTLAAYHKIGGLKGALAQHADRTLSQLNPAQQEIARRIFLRLVQPGEGTSDTRRRAVFEEVLSNNREVSDVEAVVQTLADASLIVTSRHPKSGQVLLDVAHEAIITAWPRLRQWLAEDRQGIRIRRQISLAAQDWQDRLRDESGLYRGARLLEAEEWVAANPAEINPLEYAFLEASLAARDRAQAEQEAQRRRELEMTRQLADEQKERADEQTQFAKALQVQIKRVEQQARLARAEQLAAQSQLAAENSADLGRSLPLLLAREAVLTTWGDNFSAPEGGRFVTPAADAALRQALATAPPWRLTLPRQRHTGRVWAAALSPDGQRLATAGADGTARLWNMTTGQETGRFVAHTDQVVAVAFSPDGQAAVTADSKGVVWLWNVASGQALQQFEGHSNLVKTVTFSPDGGRVVTAGAGGAIHLWQTTTGELLQQLGGHTGEIEAVAVSPDGRLLATASSDGTARLWDAATGEALYLLAGHTDRLTGVVFSPDNEQLITASADCTAQAWTVTGQKLRRLTGHSREIVALAYHPANPHLCATAGVDQTVCLWNTATGERLHQLNEPGEVQAVLFSPDAARSRLLTIGKQGLVRGWDVATGQEIRRPGGHVGPINATAFSPDGRLGATAGEDGTVRLWELATGQELKMLSGHSGPVTSLAFSPNDRRLVTASVDETGRVWDITAGQEITWLKGHTAGLTSVAFSPNGQQVVTAAHDKTARIWEAATGQERRQFSGHTGPVYSAKFDSAGQRVVTAGEDGTARLWDATTGQEIQQFTGHAGAVTSAFFSAQTSPEEEALIVTAGADGTVRWRRVETGEEVRRFTGGSEPILSIAAGPAKNEAIIITTGSDQTARVWETKEGRLWQVLVGHPDSAGRAGSVRAAAVSPPQAQDPEASRLVITGGVDGLARLWALRFGSKPQTQFKHSGSVYSAVVSPDQQLLLTAGADNIVRLWDISTGAVRHQLTGHTASVWSARFDPAGQMVATAGEDGSVRLWTVATGSQVRHLTGHMGLVSAVAFSPDGQRLVSAGWDRTARLWDAATGAEIERLSGHIGTVTAATFSPDGKAIATVGADHTVRLWDSTTGQEIERFDNLRRGLTMVAFDPTGQIMAATGQTGTVWMWDLSSRQALTSLTGHRGRVNWAAFNPGGDHIVTAGTDGTVRLWQAATGQETRQIRDHTGPVRMATFSPNGQQIVSAAEDGTVRLWEANIEVLLEQAERLIQRDPPALTPPERRRFGLESALSGAD